MAVLDLEDISIHVMNHALKLLNHPQPDIEVIVFFMNESFKFPGRFTIW